jgi:methionine synthase I (cobalamin-dependent)
MSRFLETLRSGRAVLMDGATGTQLQRRGLGDSACYEACNLEHPDWVLDVHREYVRAGAECLLTNTFQANPLSLACHLREGMLADIIERGCRLAREAAGPDRFVIGDVGPLFDAAAGEEVFDEALFRRVFGAFADVDAVLLETFSSPGVGAAVGWAGELGLPVLLSLTYGPELQTRSGHSPEWFAKRARGWGVAALGVNCGRDINMAETIEIIRRYRRVTDLPLFARPNAGTPVRHEGRWVYPRSAEAMAGRLPELLEAGAVLVGGCCGTTPDHIAAFRPVVDAWNRHGQGG